MSAVEPLVWQFPLPRSHTGIVLGNGVQGVMIWGIDALCLTVARAGFWDHRGGNPFTARTTYAALRGPLQAYDAAAIAAIYNDAVENTTAIWNERTVDAADRVQWMRDRQARGYPVLVAIDAAGAVAGEG